MPKPLSLQQAHDMVRRAGAEPLFSVFRGSPQKHSFQCKCGAEEEVVFSTIGKKLKADPNYVLRCSTCRSVPILYYSVEMVQELFIEHGATPLFTEYTGLSQSLEYECGCGNLRTVTLESLNTARRNNPQHIIRCQECAHKGYRPTSIEEMTERVSSFLNECGAKLLTPYVSSTAPLTFECACGAEYTTTWNSLENRSNKAHCGACQLAARPRGEEHPSWNPDLTDEHRQSARYGRGHSMQKWYRDVIRRANYTCAITGQVGGELAAHHLRWYSRHPELRLDPDNGICISKAIHDEFHRRHKNPEDEVAAFEEFVQTHYAHHLASLTKL